MTDYSICFFSATGNTKKCAKLFIKALEQEGKTVSEVVIENGKEQSKESQNFIIGYPIHGFGTPKNVLDFAENIPCGKGKAYLFKTSGEPLRLNDNSSSTLVKILKKKGYDVRGEYHYIMPYNMIFRHSDSMAAKMYLTAKERIERDVLEIIGGSERKKKIPLRAKIAYGVSLIEHPGVRLNGKFFRVKKSLCVRCMLCVKNCPTHNIIYKDNKFKFGWNCILCSRCAFFCPKNAVRIGLMDFMRVNGKYDFSADPSKAKIGKYCHRSYVRYFSE